MLITDVPEVARPVSADTDKEKSAVLEKCFTVVADRQVRGRRVTVYERLRTER